MENNIVKHMRCGECGQKAYKEADVKGKLAIAWKDFPKAYLTKSLVLPVCENCGNHALPAEAAPLLDSAIEASVKDQVKQFIEIIKNKADITSTKLAETLGLSPETISQHLNERKIPSFRIWNELRLIAKDPVNRLSEMDPELDVREQNILLRA